MLSVVVLGIDWTATGDAAGRMAGAGYVQHVGFSRQPLSKDRLRAALAIVRNRISDRGR